MVTPLPVKDGIVDFLPSAITSSLFVSHAEITQIDTVKMKRRLMLFTTCIKNKLIVFEFNKPTFIKCKS